MKSLETARYTDGVYWRLLKTTGDYKKLKDIYRKLQVNNEVREKVI